MEWNLTSNQLSNQEPGLSSDVPLCRVKTLIGAHRYQITRANLCFCVCVFVYERVPHAGGYVAAPSSNLPRCSDDKSRGTHRDTQIQPDMVSAGFPTTAGSSDEALRKLK